jgi:hypothetical protein
MASIAVGKIVFVGDAELVSLRYCDDCPLSASTPMAAARNEDDAEVTMG